MILIVDHAVYGPAVIVSLRKESVRKRYSQSQPAKQANACSICKKTGHTKRSPLCSGYKPEAFFYTRPATGLKVRESTTAKPAIEPAAMPAPAIEPATMPAPAIEPAAMPAPAIEPAAKPAAKPAIKPAAKPAAKPADKPTAKTAAKKAKE